jgi:uncharacterized membrane protein
MPYFEQKCGECGEWGNFHKGDRVVVSNCQKIMGVAFAFPEDVPPNYVPLRYEDNPRPEKLPFMIHKKNLKRAKMGHIT